MTIDGMPASTSEKNRSTRSDAPGGELGQVDAAATPIDAGDDEDAEQQEQGAEDGVLDADACWSVW